MKQWCALSIAILMSVALISVAQDYRHLSTVHDGSGIMSTNTVTIGSVDYRHVSAAGQPGGIFTSTNSPYINYAGFLQAVDIKKWDLDTDGDGVVDEIDADNDNDNLTDQSEVAGTGFDPNTATDPNNPDTDGDLVPDDEEQIAGTDPTNENAFLQITDIQMQGEDKVVEWTARDGKQYRLRYIDGSHAYPTGIVGSTTAAGGSAPWYETTATYTNTGATDNRSYGVEVLP